MDLASRRPPQVGQDKDSSPEVTAPQAASAALHLSAHAWEGELTILIAAGPAALTTMKRSSLDVD